MVYVLETQAVALRGALVDHNAVRGYVGSSLWQKNHYFFCTCCAVLSIIVTKTALNEAFIKIPLSILRL